MRFPSFSDLDLEQRNVYGGAPTDGAILVVGPPGTGKTVMAFHRAHRLKELGQDPSVVMFNRVLRDYSSSRSGVAPDVPTSTMHSWVNGWWRKAGMGKVPILAGDDPYAHDWMTMLDLVLDLGPGDKRIEKLDWGHLLIDEGQDFPEALYFALGKIMQHLSRHGAQPSVTVFADDNQRLNVNRNCSVASIASNLRIHGDSKRNFLLKKNYRNTLDVAKFAQYFQVGRSSGAATLPDRRGEVPLALFFRDLDEMAGFVIRKARLAPGKQVGILVHGWNSVVRKVFNQVSERAGKAGIIAQSYTWNSKSKAKRLDFETPGTITVLNEKSAKGLEFDLVFYVGLEGMNTEQTGGLNERMAMYVMASRAREELVLCFKDIDLTALPPSGLSLLPPPKYRLCRYDVASSGGPPLGPYLEKVAWQEPPPGSPYWGDEA